MKRLAPWIALILALAVLAGVYLYISAAITEQNNKVRKPRPQPPEEAIQISVIEASTGSYAASITASGLAEPRYSLTLTSQVSGEVSQVADQFESGQVVKKGQLLASLANTELQSEVASAKNTLASAILALKEEIRQGEQAKAEWQASGFNTAPDSDLVLREPQLAAAQAQVDAAKAALKDAQADLAHSQIRAPFDALVIARSVSPGSYVSAGSEIGSLYSIDRAEIEIDLSNSDWLKLPDMATLLNSDWPVSIHSIDDDSEWQGKIISVGQHIDDSTRMRSLVVALEQPLAQTEPLLLGSFVTIKLSGKSLDNLWRLPNTALSQKSEIWYLDEDSRLAAFETTPKFVDSQYVYIDVPEAMREGRYQVLLKPYNSYVKGSLVAPITASNTANKGNQP